MIKLSNEVLKEDLLTVLAIRFGLWWTAKFLWILHVSESAINLHPLQLHIYCIVISNGHHEIIVFHRKCYNITMLYCNIAATSSWKYSTSSSTLIIEKVNRQIIPKAGCRWLLDFHLWGFSCFVMELLNCSSGLCAQSICVQFRHLLHSTLPVAVAHSDVQKPQGCDTVLTPVSPSVPFTG